MQSDQVHILLEDIMVIRISYFNMHTTIIGFIACIIIMIFRKINKKIPNALIVVVLGIVVLRIFWKITF